MRYSRQIKVFRSSDQDKSWDPDRGVVFGRGNGDGLLYSLILLNISEVMNETFNRAPSPNYKALKNPHLLNTPRFNGIQVVLSLPLHTVHYRLQHLYTHLPHSKVLSEGGRSLCSSCMYHWGWGDYLQLSMTKELMVDLRRTRALVSPVSIKGISVDIVEEYKYLGVYGESTLGPRHWPLSIFWESRGPSTSARWCSLWWPLSSSTPLCAGVDWGWRTPTDSS